MLRSNTLETLCPVGEHERIIKSHFDGRAVFDGTSPLFDQPLILLGFYNRCGSNLCAEYLRNTAKFSGFGESLNADMVLDVCTKHSLTSFPDYISRHLSKRHKPGSLYGFKASSDQTAMLLRLGIDKMFTGVKIVHIWREDTLGQAISAHIAWQTQKWTSRVEGNSTVPQYDSKYIAHFMQEIANSHSAFSVLGSGLGIPLHQMTYEGLIDRPKASVESVAAFLGADVSDWQVPEKTVLTKQADSLNEAFRAQFSQEVWETLGRTDPV
ncbi:MAG: Stf0 family sulfotransferase [Rhodobacterales bacterium]